MAEPIRQQIIDVLTAATGSNSTIDISEVDGRYSGHVLWDGFAKSSPSERQDLIWKHLEDKLSASDRLKITFIITDTPEEYETIRSESAKDGS